MAKPKVFISSTFYDLKHVRSDLEAFIKGLGYEAVRHEDGGIPYGKEETLEAYCYKEIKNIDILISIIGGKFGSKSENSEYSISQCELKVAIKENKQIYIFIEKNVYSEYETYFLNKDKGNINYKYADDVRIYHFIEEIKEFGKNTIIDFETATDITNFLKEQFAGLFQRYLESDTRAKEISLINKLESTANTLNKMVNFLSDENQDKEEEINRILMINHPLVESIKAKLKIAYNYYIEGLDDLNLFLKSRGFELGKSSSKTYSNDYLYWSFYTDEKKYIISVATSLFDKKNYKLKFLKKTDWKEDYCKFETIDRLPEKEDLPF